MSEYKCKYCNNIYTRNSNKKRVKSYCSYVNREVKLVKIKRRKKMKFSFNHIVGSICVLGVMYIIPYNKLIEV